MKKGIVILAEDYCPHWEKLFLEEKPHSVGIHFRPFDEGDIFDGQFFQHGLTSEIR